MPKTHYQANKVVDAACNPQATMASATWLGLVNSFTDAKAGTCTEVADANYDRLSVSAGLFPAAASGAASSNSAVEFTDGTGMASSGGADGWAIWDASTGGNMLVYASFTERETWTAGQQPTFAAGQLLYTED